ncbi:MAG: transglycosylase domain-containing protein, partial [Clostridia bacterium]|nr:transglycosylase domain-containing protein [Clostridia bacterium]
MMEKQKPKKFKKLILIFSIILCSVFAVLMVCGTVLYNSVSLDVAKLTSTNNGIRVYSATGEDATLYNSNRSIVEIDTLPDYVLNAFIDTEDKNFYNHHGYDFKRICKALFVNLTTHSKSQGASTISQQLVKNALLSNEKTYKRKLEELVLSIKMEKQFTKQDILQMYLNTIYFGSNAYGIENASTTYFGKSAKDLSLSEACCLAGLIKSPAKYSPKTNMQNAVERRNLVASLMKENGHITDKQLNDVVSAPIDVVMGTENEYGYEKEAIYEACKLLNITERELINRDYQIITNKDDGLQAEVIRINREILSETEEKYNESLDSISVVADDAGKIVAYYCNSNYNLHNVKRQPAS